MFIDNLYIAVRKEEVEKIREKFPDRIPIIVEKAKTSKLPDIDKTK
jgi:GABA(A) receptor-associated protein